jgi:hypothetical protein
LSFNALFRRYPRGVSEGRIVTVFAFDLTGQSEGAPFVSCILQHAGFSFAYVRSMMKAENLSWIPDHTLLS